MAATCLNTIISIESCEEEVSLSGFALSDLPGISIQMAAHIADSDYIKGIELLKDKRRIAILKIKNDLLKYLNGSGYIANVFSSLWRSGVIKTKVIAAGTAGQFRGAVFYAKENCALKKTYIPAVYIKSAEDIETTLTIVDGPNEYDYEVTLYAGKIVKVNVNFTAEYGEIQILLPSEVSVYSVDPHCDCPDKKSDCVKTLGISNNTTNTAEAYGITADVQCQCNYDLILCSLATNGLLGEVALYKTGVEVMDEAIKTDRLNFFTTYGKEENTKTLREWEARYGDAWNTLITALPKTLPSIDRCGCLDCGGTKIKSNI